MNAAHRPGRARGGRRAGFTLIELLLSISLTAMVGAMAFAGLDAAVNAGERSQENAERLREVNLAMMILARDLRQARRRSVRNEQGEYVTAFFGNGAGEQALVMTRGGWQNPAGRARSNMQRVYYHLRDNALIRESWTVLDRLPGAESFSNTLLSRVNSLQIKFLRPLVEDDAGGRRPSGSEWHDRWIPDLNSVPDFRGENHFSAFLPVAVDIEMELEDLGRVRRIFAVAAEWPLENDYLSRWYRQMSLGGS